MRLTRCTDYFVPGQRRRPHRDVLTVVFTDISGSTALASKLGDRRWRRVRSDHDEIVRRELLRWGGHEIDTSGDGFFATFDRPGHAVGCARTISDAVRAIGVDVRIGLHVGEVEVVGGKVSGIAVHIGFRVASLAKAGEVLVTSTLRESMAGSTTGFEYRGVYVLEGVPGEWRIFAVERGEVPQPPKAVLSADNEAEISKPEDLRARSVVALMFTDILGATELASELGDRRWRGLLTAHDRVIRRHLRRFGGSKMDQAGDRFFATFERTASAVECAEAIMHDVQRLGIKMRIGVHVGEVEGTGGKAGGASVHVGARVLACAEAGEVLVTSTAKDSLLGTGRRFEDRGVQRLKGLTDNWHLYRIIRS
jgi:class 3 adenylate cyclase